jgi:hypothetical protein
MNSFVLVLTVIDSGTKKFNLIEIENKFKPYLRRDRIFPTLRVVLMYFSLRSTLNSTLFSI